MKKPNFDFERRERDKAKALKKAEKLAAKASKGQSDADTGETGSDQPTASATAAN
ncbi:hypothetical protein [Aureimonas sp. Leaf454]|uniref:hypothetical protein n=1 Tax=Aureimonas sp. Leaf454 TaxID=1736381 RepID=UPI0012E37539|nr:hypothetical protein [Aureimonas sp. Leaf454]